MPLVLFLLQLWSKITCKYGAKCKNVELEAHHYMVLIYLPFFSFFFFFLSLHRSPLLGAQVHSQEPQCPDYLSPNLRPRHQELIPTPCGPVSASHTNETKIYLRWCSVSKIDAKEKIKDYIRIKMNGCISEKLGGRNSTTFCLPPLPFLNLASYLSFCPCLHSLNGSACFSYEWPVSIFLSPPSSPCGRWNAGRSCHARWRSISASLWCLCWCWSVSHPTASTSNTKAPTYSMGTTSLCRLSSSSDCVSINAPLAAADVCHRHTVA